MSISHDTIGEYLIEHDPVQVLWHRLDELVGGHGWARQIPGSITLPAATIFLVGLFEGEVVKGGFGQFLFGPPRDLAGDSLQALREVGAHVSVELLEKAMAIFPGGSLPTALDEWAIAVSRFEQDTPTFFEPFDELFNQHVDAQSPHRVENLNTLLLDYMKEHAAVRLTY